MAIPHPFSDALAGLIADRFRVLAEPMRIRLLDQLHDGPMAVGALAAALGTSQQNVSKHLALLYGAGIVGRERVGNEVHYDIADQTVFDLCEHVCGGIQRQLTELSALMGEEVSR